MSDAALTFQGYDEPVPGAGWLRLRMSSTEGTGGCLAAGCSGSVVDTPGVCVAGSVGELNDGGYRAGPQGAVQRSSSWGRVCPLLGSRRGGGCVSC